MAKEIERIVNTTDSAKEQLDVIIGKYGQKTTRDFFLACITCWADYGRFDDRNAWAVLLSKEIVTKFTSLNEARFSEEIFTEAYSFVIFAHRALQQQLFCVVCRYLKDTGYMGIAGWLNKKQFKINLHLGTVTPTDNC